MDKKRLLQEIIAQLRQDAAAMLAAARETRDAATHEDNKAESKYDTRGMEASYLAEAQARKAEDAEANLAKFEALSHRGFSREDPIAIGALATVEISGHRDLYFFGPGAGGLEIEIDGQECTVVTRDSPLGRHLFGAKLGHGFAINGQPAKIVEIR